MKRNREQSQRLIIFWGASLLFVVISLLLSTFSAGYSTAMSSRSAGVTHLLRLVEVQLAQDPRAEAMADWMPDILTSFRAQSFRLERDGELLLGWQNDFIELESTITYTRPLHDDYTATLKIPSPNLFKLFSWREWLMIGSGVFVALLMIRFGHRWLRDEMRGIEQLAQHGARINQGDFSAAVESIKGLRPLSAARAYKTLYDLWREEREAKLELDRQVRTNAFQDRESGLGNRMFFERRLMSMSEDGKFQTNGIICLMQFAGLEDLPVETRLPVLQQFIDLAEPILAEHSKSVFSRLHWLQLGLVVPDLPLKEAESLALKLHRLGERLHLPAKADAENFLDIGVTYFYRNEHYEHALDDAEQALRASQLQGQSNWFMYEKDNVDRQLAQGTVRWRSIIEAALNRNGLQANYQELRDESGNVVKREQFSQLLDQNGKVLPASLYLPMAQRCGLRPRIERDLIAMALQKMQQEGWEEPVAVNLCAESVMHPRFGKSVAMLLANYQVRRTQLVVEINERELVYYGTKMSSVLKELKKLGLQLAVDGVGYTVEHTSYIDDFSVDWLKLHPSLVRHIDRRPDCQMVVSSLCQASAQHNLRIIAEGVEEQVEWDHLQQLGVQVGQGRFFATEA